jgi:uncharacterized membrane protein
LGVVGSILVLLTAVPSVGGVFGVIGFILILIAIKYISDIVADKSIFNNMLVAVVLAIAGIVTGTLVVLGSFFRFMGLNGMTFSSLGPSFNPSTVPAGDWFGLIASVIVGLAAVWVMLLASAVYVRRSYSEIATKLNVPMFGTAGLVYLIGAATTIVLVGFAILFVAEILLAVAFFSIEEEKKVLEPATVAQAQRPMPTNAQEGVR